jgi:uncharacterized protein (TIGR02594 family)
MATSRSRSRWAPARHHLRAAVGPGHPGHADDGRPGQRLREVPGRPWGIALSTAAVALLPFIGKLFEAGDATTDLVEKLKKEARQSADNDNAHRVFASTLEGETEALKKNRDALKGLTDQEKTAAERALQAAIVAKMRLQNTEAQTEADIKAAKAAIELNRARAQVAGMDPRVAGPVLAEADAASARLTALEASLPDITAKITEADKQIADATSRVYVDAVMRDPVESIKKRYDGLIEQARQRGLAEHKTFEEIAKQTEELKRQRDVKIKAEEERQRKAPANAGGTAIFDEQIASFFDIANRYRGKSETADRGTLKAFLGNVDPEKTAWCAAFVNAVLASGGVTGTGSLAAKSFMTYGKDDTRSPQKGDIVVLKSSASPSGTHVGFLESIDTKGNVRVLGGNTGNKVGTLAASKDDVLAIRRPPTPSEAAAAGDKAANSARDAQSRFDDQLASLHAQQLRAEGEVLKGAQAQADLKMRQIAAAEDAQVKAIANDLADGKYGDATSQLAQERAKQLTQAVHQTATQERINLGLEGYLRWLSEQDAAREQQAQIAIDQKQFDESIARTTDDHRKLQLEILDLVYEEKKRHLEYLKAQADLVGNTAEAARIQAQINDLPRQKANDTRHANDNTRRPLDDYLNRMPQSAAEINERVEQLTVDELESVRQGIDGAITKALGIKDPLLEGLIDLFIQQVLIKPIANALNGAMNAQGGGGLGGFLGMLGGLFGGGGGLGGMFAAGTGTASLGLASEVTVGGGIASSLSAPSISALMGFATGTESAPGGYAWVGENGKELVRLPRGSKVYNSSASRRLEAANDRMRMMPVGDTYHIGVNVNGGRGSTPAEDRRTGIQIAAGIHQQLARTSRKGLMGGSAS